MRGVYVSAYVRWVTIWRTELVTVVVMSTAAMRCNPVKVVVQPRRRRILDVWPTRSQNNCYMCRNTCWNVSKKQQKLEGKDVVPNINRMPAAERAEKCNFFVPGNLYLWPSNLSEQGTDLPQICSAVLEIFHTQTKNTDWRRQKQNLPQFTACGTTTTTVLQPFVRDYPGEPAPEETLTHPPSWSPSYLYQLLPSATIHSILLVQITCLPIFLHNLSPCPLYLLVWSLQPHIPYISSPNKCLLFAAHAHTIAACFAVVSILYHLFPTPYLELCLLP